MDNKTLRRVQLVLLEIAKEVKRVCDENNIKYFLDSGTLLGAVRHSGFIPWDDDLDIGMMREDYNRFCEIAPSCLKHNYFLQTWNNDSNYALPFAKVRKKNTIYLENKANNKMINGFYVDIFPYDNAPATNEEKLMLMKRLSNLERTILMKCHYQPWNEFNRINYKKRIGYVPYQLKSVLLSKDKLISRYMQFVNRESETAEDIYLQYGGKKGYYIKKASFGEGIMLNFEDELFRCPLDYDAYLKSVYGDYMKLPPVDQRENRHQILTIKF